MVPVKDTNNASVLEVFAARYKDTIYSVVAKARIAELETPGVNAGNPAVTKKADADIVVSALPDAMSTKRQSGLEIVEWSGDISSRDQNFWAFADASENKIVKITGSASDEAVVQQENGTCTIGHTHSDGTGTDYSLECRRLAGQWRVSGFFTQQEHMFTRGHMVASAGRRRAGSKPYDSSL